MISDSEYKRLLDIAIERLSICTTLGEEKQIYKDLILDSYKLLSLCRGLCITRALKLRSTELLNELQRQVSLLFNSLSELLYECIQRFNHVYYKVLKNILTDTYGFILNFISSMVILKESVHYLEPLTVDELIEKYK